MPDIHSFHIPVMGTGFSIDTPVKVAPYGIHSVISIVDDSLVEEMREYYSELFKKPFTPITKEDYDYRARRITEYLNLVDDIVQEKFSAVRNSCFEIGSEITKYFEMLSDKSPLKKLYQDMLIEKNINIKNKLQEYLRSAMKPGDINVNIMTKLDRINYSHDEALPDEFSDALAAFRGYALSKLQSAMTFSAGINRHLYSYIEKFEDFFADADGFFKKKIILKVSDYRSSAIQGRFLAKKGIWVSEYRIESALNCGGHAFASDGFLVGPILEEFKQKRDELILSLFEVYNKALAAIQRPTFSKLHEVRITAQGGIGTPAENEFLMNYYKLDATGWASPFLLVPEVTNVDEGTRQKLADAGEDQFYLSDVSPLGVPFNNFKGNLSDAKKDERIAKGVPGSPCPKGYLVSNTEFTPKPICTASRQYQKLKIEQLEKIHLAPEAFKQKYDQITQKACICNDLAEGVLIQNKIFKNNNTNKFSAVCPGPNLAYFSKISTLKEMVDHIYGRINLLNSTYRPHMFIKDLNMYSDYFFKEVKKLCTETNDRNKAYLNEFYTNLMNGIHYYQELFPIMVFETEKARQKAIEELETYRVKIESFILPYRSIFPHPEKALVSV